MSSVSRTIGSGLASGGPVALVYGYLFVITGSVALSASIAEMASMCPISGAQVRLISPATFPMSALFKS